MGNDEIKECKRCGTCCKKGPPTLHIQDIPYIKTGKISFTNLITLRIGEFVYENVCNKIISLDRELVKLKTKQNSTECIFLKENRCSIYEFRPIECRKLKCWDIDEFTNFYTRDRITRFSLIPENSAMGEIIKEHERKTDVKNFMELLSRFKITKDRYIKNKLEEIISYDITIRDYIQEKTGARDELAFLFGRPLKELLYRKL